MSKKAEILFVYNLNSGYRSKISALLGQSSCPLYSLTHGRLRQKTEWRSFLQTLSVKNSFLHRDEFKQKVTKLDISFPIIFLRGQGRLQTFLTAKEIRNCRNLDQLITSIDKKLKSARSQNG